MRAIDADAFEADLNEILLPKLIELYGRDEALRGLHFSFRDLICNIQVRSTIEPERTEKWIPCSIRSPQTGLNLVTYKDGTVDMLEHPTAYRYHDIIAWMPLPEPYKEG